MWIDRAVKWLLPREDHFFDLLERGAASAAKASGILVEACNVDAGGDRAGIIARMTDEEHAADRVIHDVYEALNKTFVTPIDRSDIYTLATALENITDAANATVLQLSTHAVHRAPPGSAELAALVTQATAEIDQAVKLLRGMKRLDEIRTRCKAVTQLEHDGDQIFRARLGEMFATEKDAVSLLKNKEFLEGIEHTLDVCDDVGNALEALVIKHS